MKRIITLLLLTLSVYGAFSQDVITYKNGKTQKVVVLTTSTNDITCQDFESKEQFTISRSFIESVVYQAGKAEPFGVVLAKPDRQMVKKDSSSKASNIVFTHPEYNSAVYKSFTELSYAGSLTKGVGSKALLTSSHGVMFQDQVFIGAMVGVGYEGSKAFGEKFATTPETVLGGIGGVDLRVKFSQDPTYFYIGGKAGGIFALSGDFDTGFFYHPNAGYVSPIGKKSGLIVSVGYMGLPSIYYTFDNRFPVYNKVTANYLTITGGITF